MDRITIKCLGLISRLGNQEDQVVENLKNNLYCTQEQLDFNNTLVAQRTRRMNRSAIMLTNTIKYCMDGIQETKDKIVPGDTGLITNIAYGPINTSINFGAIVSNDTPELASPMDFANTVNNAVVGHAAMYFGFKGPSTLLMGGNSILYTMDLLKKNLSKDIFACGVEEYCKPIFDYAERKFSRPLFSEGASAVLLSNQGESDYGYIIGSSEAGLGYSPLFSDCNDETDKFIKLFQNAINSAQVDAGEIDAIFYASDGVSGLREAEEKAVEGIFTGAAAKVYVKDLLGETLGASMTLSLALAAITIKSGIYKKILVSGIEVSGTLEAFVVSRD